MQFRQWLEEQQIEEGFFKKKLKTPSTAGGPVFLGGGDPKSPSKSYSAGRGSMRRKMLKRKWAEIEQEGREEEKKRKEELGTR